MREHEFSLILSSPEESEEEAERLFEAGCDDGTIITTAGVTRIDFQRMAPTLEEAIRSAIENVKAAGFQVAHVRMEPGSVAKA